MKQQDSEPTIIEPRPVRDSSAPAVIGTVVSFAAWLERVDRELPRMRELIATKRAHCVAMAVQRAQELLGELAEVLCVERLDEAQMETIQRHKVALSRCLEGRL